MNKNYVLSTLFATMSCTTTAVSVTPSQPEYERGICPIRSAEIPFESDRYVINPIISSNISVPHTEEQNDFDVLVSFANKMLNNEANIDLEIQQVINDSFWDML